MRSFQKYFILVGTPIMIILNLIPVFTAMSNGETIPYKNVVIAVIVLILCVAYLQVIKKTEKEKSKR